MQLQEAARHGNLYHDLALGCAMDGGEIEGQPGAFAGGVSIGAPPDPFSAAGQVWNLPPFSPIALNREAMEPCAASYPPTCATRRHCASTMCWALRASSGCRKVLKGATAPMCRFPLDALIAVTALESRRNRCLVVGEDLGTVPDGLREKLARGRDLLLPGAVVRARRARLQAAGSLSRAGARLPRLA